tara:strand:- start:556 stop:1092 length:537 start_codon:yes stop_codon:yes gene_type:complete
MAQVRPVTSEALEAQIRDLLPSQSGFTEDLQASNVITPIIDLTNAAEGSSTPEFLQRAWDFSTGHSTITSGTTNLITTTGFWQVDLTFQSDTGAGTREAKIEIDDGSSSKVVWETNVSPSGSNNPSVALENAFIVFLRAGDTLKGTCTTPSSMSLDVWYRQVADVNGVLTNPQGFTPQ